MIVDSSLSSQLYYSAVDGSLSLLLSVCIHSYAHLYLFVHAHKESRGLYWVYSVCSLPFIYLLFLRQGLSLNLALAILACLAGQGDPGIYLSYPIMLWSQTDMETPGFLCGYWDLDPCPHACTPSISPATQSSSEMVL